MNVLNLFSPYIIVILRLFNKAVNGMMVMEEETDLHSPFPGTIYGVMPVQRFGKIRDGPKCNDSGYIIVNSRYKLLT